MARSKKSADAIEQKLVDTALEKQRNGKVPTARELAALKRQEAAREEELRAEYYATVPKKHYTTLSGRDTRTLHSHADLYGLPLRGKTIDLASVLKAIHDLLAKEGHKLRARESTAKDRDDELKAVEREVRIRKQLGQLVEIEKVKTSLGVIASIYRQVGDGLGRKYGSEAQKFMNEAIDRAEKELERQFGS